MESDNYNKLSMEGISKISDPHVIKNFILSNQVRQPFLLFQETFIFDGFMLGLCLKGKGRIKVNFKEYELMPGCIVLLLPNRIVKIEKESDDFLMETLFMSFDLIIEFPTPKGFNLLDSARIVPCIRVSESEILHLLEYHDFILKQYIEIDNIYREEIVKSLLYGLMLEISAVYNSNKNDSGHLLPVKHEELSDNFFRLLMKHYKKERNVSFYADKLCLTPKYLSTLIKKITGKPVLSWINETVIIEAKVLIKTTNLSILQVSEELNFPNPSFFIQFFKQHTGMTPLQYRNS